MNEKTSTAAESSFCPPERRHLVLIAAILASSMGFIDGSVLAIATPAIRADLGAVAGRCAVDLQRLPAVPLLAAPDRRRGGRPVRPAQCLRRRHLPLRCRLAGFGARARPGFPDRGAGGAGARRRVHGAGQPRHHRQGLSARRARQGDRAVVLVLVADDHPRPGGRRVRPDHAGRLELAPGVRDQPAARASSRWLLLFQVPADTPGGGAAARRRRRRAGDGRRCCSWRWG